uniref:Uncharacterized protein n=1 Tax=Rhizophora mucronata TaxID=61149 RepID=A0A2P2QVV9_RHIMU
MYPISSVTISFLPGIEMALSPFKGHLAMAHD